MEQQYQSARTERACGEVSTGDWQADTVRLQPLPVGMAPSSSFIRDFVLLVVGFVAASHAQMLNSGGLADKPWTDSDIHGHNVHCIEVLNPTYDSTAALSGTNRETYKWSTTGEQTRTGEVEWLREETGQDNAERESLRGDSGVYMRQKDSKQFHIDLHVGIVQQRDWGQDIWSLVYQIKDAYDVSCLLDF